MYVAAASLDDAGFPLAVQEVHRLLEATVEAAQSDFDKRHRIIDALDTDVAAATQTALAAVLGELSKGSE